MLMVNGLIPNQAIWVQFLVSLLKRKNILCLSSEDIHARAQLLIDIIRRTSLDNNCDHNIQHNCSFSRLYLHRDSKF